VDGFEEAQADNVQVIRLNVLHSESKPLLAALSFRFVPTFILLDDRGEELWRETGTFEPDNVIQLMSIQQ